LIFKPKIKALDMYPLIQNVFREIEENMTPGETRIQFGKLRAELEDFIVNEFPDD